MQIMVQKIYKSSETNKSPDHINPELKTTRGLNYHELIIMSSKISTKRKGFVTIYHACWFDRINSAWEYGALKVIRDSNKNEQEFIQTLSATRLVVIALADQIREPDIQYLKHLFLN
ncbi:7928_t:CDS:1 [Cetraspora pellucida]|uniref:7928_t:CDS:1 n=1 Tax=Cetraspora pellucida TaxID=1433469 RepID=A0ACA9LT65_9GLOM|nr:7928_t:CDS:1 [Cetraspora pellucida]